MKDKQPILSICIPTYNRAEILRQSLQQIVPQLSKINEGELEIFISDNCSPDNTKSVVADYIKQGAPITYSRNDENIGGARNFLKCIQWASGKYIYLLGDDDLLGKNAIYDLLNILRSKDYGLIYINTRTRDKFNNGIEEIKDINSFIKQVSYFYTFMSGCIFRKDAVPRVSNPEQYLDTCFIQIPFYLKSTLMYSLNAVVSIPIFEETGLAAKSNGGYNFFEVFVQNYLTIMGEYIQNVDLMKWLKKDIWPFVWMYTRRLLIDKNVVNFKVENGWKILFQYYSKEWYFWWTLFKYPFGSMRRIIMKGLKR